MRGTLRKVGVSFLHGGIIPAYAGNTLPRILLPMPCWDHPRVCGEHPSMSTTVLLTVGSSPRMRGTLGKIAAPRRAVGIIPAYAGNTRSMKSGIDRGGDHPRVCGEHDVCNSGLAVNQGSSPRMRGTRFGGEQEHRHPGIIPAYAGNTSASFDVIFQ